MEKILTFNLSPSAEAATAGTAAIMRIKVTPVETKEYGSALERILDREATSDYDGETPPESMIILCGIVGERFNRFLNLLRKTGAQIDYKAVLTRENCKWTPIKMFEALKEERQDLEITND